MQFDRAAFREALQGRNQPIEEFMKESLHASLQEDSQIGGSWLNAMFAQLEAILKESTNSPYLKLEALKFVVHLLLFDEKKIFKLIEEKVYPYVRNLSQYDRNSRMDTKGSELFKNHSVYIKGTPQEKQEVRSVGLQYVRLCLESVPVWAAWHPADSYDEKKKSLFCRSYQALVRDGMQFPQQHQYLFYTKKNVELMELKAHEVVDQVGQERIPQQSSVTSSFPDQDSQQSLKKKKVSNLRLRGSIINDPRTSKQLTNSQVREIKKQPLPLGSPGFVSLANNLAGKGGPMPSQRSDKKQKELMMEVQRLRRELDIKTQQLTSQPDLQAPLISRIRQMEQREADLLRTIELQKQALLAVPAQKGGDPSRQVSELRNQLQQTRIENSNLQNEIRELRITVLQLSQQNQTLRSQNSQIQRSQNQPQPQPVTSPRTRLSAVTVDNSEVQSLRQQIKKLQEQNRELKVNLLSQCIESTEFNQSDLKRHRSSRIRFEDYIPEELFEPYFSNLSTEEQIRFRKAVLKNKELLTKDPIIEIGCVTQVISTNKLKLNLFLTNVSRENITDVECSLSCGRGVSLVKGNERPLSTIAPSYQEKVCYTFELTSENFGCAAFTLKYNVSGQLVTKQMLLPISKVKLSQPKAYLPDSELTGSKQKTVQLDARMMQSISRLPEYFRLMYQKNENGTTYYHLQFCYLKDKYELIWIQLGKFVRMVIRFAPDCEEEAERLLDEWAFLLNKESS